MAIAFLISGIVLVYYGVKAHNANPTKPNWNKAIAATILWPISLFMDRYK
ncbi:hypothetical protein [Spirosoma endbachense]|nr:hypothetical protein [Spirosoma endbachense]